MFEEIPETPYGMRKRIRFIYEEIEKRINSIKAKRKIKILDIGCGTGQFITIPLGSLGADILGIDIDLPSIEYARRINPYENVRFECSTVDKLSDQQFDFIICSEVLEHLEEPEEILGEIKKMLKQNGICIVTIPNGFGPKEIETRIYNILKNIKLISLLRVFKHKLYSKSIPNKTSKMENLRDTLNDASLHRQFFSYKRFKKIQGQSGLKIIKWTNRRFLSGPFSARFLGRSERLINWNVKVAERLPHFCVSSWMFVIEHNKKAD